MLTKEITLPSLSRRRLEQDLCEVYKYIHGHYKTGSGEPFHMAHRQLSGHSRKLFRPSSKTVPRSNFFSLRVNKKWNALPQEIVEASTLSSFKSKLSVLLSEEEGQIWLIWFDLIWYSEEKIIRIPRGKYFLFRKPKITRKHYPSGKSVSDGHYMVRT